MPPRGGRVAGCALAFLLVAGVLAGAVNAVAGGGSLLVFPALLPAVFVAALYGGYFGGAVGVVLVVTLSLFAQDGLVRLNALKGLLSLVIATVTVAIFAFGAPVD